MIGLIKFTMYKELLKRVTWVTFEITWSFIHSSYEYTSILDIKWGPFYESKEYILVVKFYQKLSN